MHVYQNRKGKRSNHYIPSKKKMQKEKKGKKKGREGGKVGS